MNDTDALAGEQINRAIAEWMGWRHLDESQVDDEYICLKCGIAGEAHGKYIPAYTLSLDAVRVAELKAILVFGYFAFAGALYMEIVDEDTDDTDDTERVVAAAAIATADQRARSIYSLIKSAQQEKET